MRTTIVRDKKLAEAHSKFDGTWPEFAEQHGLKSESTARAAVERGNKALNSRN